MIVFDASVLMTLLSSEDFGRPARLAMLEDDVAAPHLIDLEFMSACRNAHRRSELSEEHALELLRRSRLVPIERFRHEPLLPRVWELRDNLTSYDASYVALAEALDCPLYTSDGGIAKAPGLAGDVHFVPGG